MAQIRKQFSSFIKGANWDNNDAFYIEDGKLCVDFVIRYESLSQDFNKVCETLGIPEIDLPHLKAGFRKKRRHYSDYFDEESRDIVAARHVNDIRLFGYEFEDAGSHS